LRDLVEVKVAFNAANKAAIESSFGKEELGIEQKLGRTTSSLDH
jgi:hypothetical protein